jgi:hypothetical protein
MSGVVVGGSPGIHVYKSVSGRTERKKSREKEEVLFFQ